MSPKTDFQANLTQQRYYIMTPGGDSYEMNVMSCEQQPPKD